MSWFDASTSTIGSPRATSEVFDEAADELIKELGWHGTAQELFDAIKGPFSEDVCRWLYGVGNSKRQAMLASGHTPDPAHQRELAEDALSKWKAKNPEQFAQLEEAKIRQYLECVMTGFEGKPMDDAADNTLIWAVLGLAGVGLLGWWMTKGKK